MSQKECRNYAASGVSQTPNGDFYERKAQPIVHGFLTKKDIDNYLSEAYNTTQIKGSSRTPLWVGLKPSFEAKASVSGEIARLLSRTDVDCKVRGEGLFLYPEKAAREPERSRTWEHM